MNTSLLGQSNLAVSTLCFGCMSLGTDEQANKRLLHEAVDQGVNFFDTADLYQKGWNESQVGSALKDRRKSVILATKVGNQWRPDGSGWDWNPRKAYIKEAVKGSLQRLQTDYIDLYQLHGGTMEDSIDETIEAFEELCAEGHIRYYGISSIRPQVIETWLNRSNIVSVMLQYSLLDRKQENQVLEMIQQKGVGVIVRGALAKGLLGNKPATVYQEYSSQTVAAVQQVLHDMTLPERSPAQMALQFCWQHPAVTTIACGMSRPSQLIENMGALNAPPLTEVEYERLKATL
ncbi:MAG TPA: aldo/keto reductase [Saprospiraceae bacterium]|nr:aldo/keto reductase [Saprospiraceae bacterium]HMQ83409.1 aldo/keto reductase [Saprospiraceae bacterium]